MDTYPPTTVFPTTVTPTAPVRDEASAGARPWSYEVVVMGLVIGACVFGLSHDFAYLESGGEQTMEAGAGVEQQDKFDANLGAAYIQRKIGFAALPMLALWCFWTAPVGVPLRWNAATMTMACLLGWCTLSLFWSEAPKETFRELIRLWVFAVACFALARRFNITQLLAILAIGAAVSVGVAFAAEIAAGHFRPWVSGYRLSGTIHANSLARHGSFVALAAFAGFLSGIRARACLLVFVIACGIVYLTKSRATLGSVICGMGAIYAVGLQLRSWLSTIAVGTTLLGGIVLIGSLSGGWVERQWEQTVSMGRQQGGGDVTSLAGRLPVWHKIWQDTASRRWIGTGYGAYWTTNKTVEIGEELEWYPRHAHSSYMELIADLGIVGVVLGVGLAVSVVAGSISLFSQTGIGAYRLVAGFVFAGMVNGLVEAAFVQPRDLGLFVGPLLCSMAFIHKPAETSEPVATKRNNLSHPITHAFTT